MQLHVQSLFYFVFISLVSSETVAYFSGPSYISYHPVNSSDNDTLHLVFKSPLSYGLLAVWLDSSHSYFFRLYLNNGTLICDLHQNNDQFEIFSISNTYQKNQWNAVTLKPRLYSISFNYQQTSYFPLLTEMYTIDFYKIYIGGIDNTIPFFAYHQYFGYFKTLVFNGVNLLDQTKNETKHIHKNVAFGGESQITNIYNSASQTVTINDTSVSFHLTASSFNNLILSFDFKTPDPTLLLLSYHMRQYFMYLRKDANQLVLECNLYGYSQKVAVDLMSVNEWVSVNVTINNDFMSLTADDRISEIKSASPVANRRLNKQSVVFGWDSMVSMGFRGCLRNVVMGRDYHVPLHNIIGKIQKTLLGCWYPTKGCFEMVCPYSCRQTWQATSCVSVPLAPPKIAQFSGYSIIQMTVPSLVTWGSGDKGQQNHQTGVSIKLKFVSTKRSTDDVLLNLRRLKDTKPFITLQMLEGFIMFSFTLSGEGVNLNTDTPLNDGELHSVTLHFTENNISFQVDERTKSQRYELDMSVFEQPTDVKIGGSSLKINSYGFSGCLSDILINGKDMLLYTVTESKVILHDVVLNQCTLLPEETNITADHTSKPHITHHNNLPTSLPSRTYYYKNPTPRSNATKGGTTSDPQNPSVIPVHKEENRDHLLLLIGLLFGVIFILSLFLFLVYFLWQKRQMHQAIKERARKLSEDMELDEEFVNKTYNPKKQDKYTLFTPHALSVIDEESEHEGSLLSVELNGSVYMKL